MSGRARAAILPVLVALVSGTGFLPPEAPPEGARGTVAPETIRQSFARAAAEGAGGGSPTLAPGAPGAHALVLLVAFSDTAWAEPDLHTTAYYDSLVFGVGMPSVRTYYEEISRGAFTLTGDVHAVRELPASIVTYTGDGQCSGCCCGTGPYPHNSQKLVEDLVARVDPEIDFAPYDGDGDGVVDLLFVVHAGIDVVDRPVPRQFGSHQWHTVETPRPDAVRVEGYALLSEWSGIGAFAHEMTHLFGIPDLWDLTCCSQGLGDWSLMASGARLGAPRYSDPAHPDPWTRQALGFVTPVTPSPPGGMGTITLEPVETTGAVLRLDANARAGPEYFLVENRRRGAGVFDGALPGEGVLVYHVDDRVALNTEPPHYKVALEQADGRFDLEFPAFFDLLGDAGDPFPGDSARTAFDDTTTPSALRHDGSPSGIALSEIALVDGVATLTVSLAEGPVLDADVTFAGETSGDGDLRPEAGEAWALDVTLRNKGRDAAGPVLVRASGGDGVDPGELEAPALASGESVTLEAAFVLTLPVALAANPAVVPLRVVLASGEATDSLEVPLVTGDRFGLAVASFESGLDGFAHGRVGLGVADPWHVSTVRASDGERALACADVGGGAYPDSIDAAATSPPVLLGAGSRAVFTHWMDAESAPPADAFDGGRVEGSRDGRTFRTLHPEGGYTHRPLTNASFPLFDGEVYSGRSVLDPSCAGGWCRAEIDLSAFDGGPFWLRLRFGSDARIGGEGWYLDEIAIETDGAPVAFHIFEPRPDETEVRLAFSVVENILPFEGSVRLERERLGASGVPMEPAEVLFSEDLSGGGRVDLSDTPLAPGETRRYRLFQVGTGGAADSLRAERILSRPSLPVRPEIAAAGPVPFGAGGTRFRVELTPSRLGPLEVAFFDAAGRRVAVRRARPLGNGSQVVEWDGRGRGDRALPPGVYFYRIEGVASGRTVLLR